jgi:hypothetical protein
LVHHSSKATYNRIIKLKTAFSGHTIAVFGLVDTMIHTAQDTLARYNKTTVANVGSRGHFSVDNFPSNRILPALLLIRLKRSQTA